MGPGTDLCGVRLVWVPHWRPRYGAPCCSVLDGPGVGQQHVSCSWHISWGKKANQVSLEDGLSAPLMDLIGLG